MLILITIVGISLLILLHELGHFLAAKWAGTKVEEFGFGFPPRLFSWRVGETRYSVNALPFGGFVKIYGEDGETQPQTTAPAAAVSDRARSFAAQPVWKRAAITLAGVAMNVLGGWFFLSVVFMVGAPAHLVITDVVPGSPAAAGGVARGDIVMAARVGEVELKDPVAAERFTTAVKGSAARGAPVALTLGRGGETLEVTLTGRAEPPAGEGPLGVAIADMGVMREPFFKSFVRGAEATWDMLTMLVGGFVRFVGALFTEPGAVKGIAGPVGIVAVAAEAGSLGVAYLLHFLALISLNLAVLNLIPFPALDGGRVLFLLIEKLKGSPLPVRFERTVNVVGFAALLVLMALVTVQDIGRLVR